MLKRIAISPESTNYGDNDANVAYLYRGYYIWKTTHESVALRGGRHDEWNYGLAVLHTPDAELGEDFEPFWDDTGLTKTCESRRDCVACIDRRLDEAPASPVAEAPKPDPDAVENVTITVSLNQARTILAALSDRHDVVQSRFNEEARLGLLTAAARTEALVDEVKAVYQSVDRQVFQGAVVKS
jgi:hypothetical protein